MSANHTGRGRHRGMPVRRSKVAVPLLAAAIATAGWAAGAGNPATAATSGPSAVTSVTTVSSAVPRVAAAKAAPTREQRLAGYVNDSRRARGLKAYTVSAGLSAVAEKQAKWMASHQKLAHNPSLTSDVKGWRALGENVAYSSGTRQAHVMLMNSPGHRANLLSRTYTQVGLGVVKDSHGRIWVCEVFRKPA